VASLDESVVGAGGVVSRSVVDGPILVEWDVPVVMDDGVVLRADVFRPAGEGRFPVLMSSGPYGKGLTWTTGVYQAQWASLVAGHPDVLEGSSGKYQNWETADPERWVPWGYALVRVDSRGAGRSPGFLDPQAPRSIQDFHDCIEWAAAQPWCSGKVGLAGISYYAVSQWLVAGTRPPHLAAICPWEGAGDQYRDSTCHGGIPSTFRINWMERQLAYVQHGVGERGRRNPNNGELASGPPTLTDDQLKTNRRDVREAMLAHPLYDQFWRDRAVDWSRIEVPLLTAANWGGQGLHPRGSYAAFESAGSRQRWLEVHGLEHWTHFYTAYGVSLQKRFFDHFLKGDDNGWPDQPPVLLQVRHVDRFEPRAEQEWPLARTQWTPLYLDLDAGRLRWDRPGPAATGSFPALTGKITLLTDPFERDTEFTGPAAATLFAASSTTDADLFVVLHLIDPDGDEVTFPGALDPHTPIGQGWLRASHRRLDPARSRPWQPYHPHDAVEPLTPGQAYELAVEIIPTSIVVPAGHRLGVSIRGSDYEYQGDLGDGADLATFANTMRGCGPFLHNDPATRPPAIYGGTTTIHAGPDHPTHILLPLIPTPNN